ncbi:hypothetical protein HYT18_00250 [Candidatus Microgenomates bacterium]|nr:hypothetical protein [Candidatus Microgenomates bacterium]
MKSQKGLVGWIVLGILAMMIIFGGLTVVNSDKSIPGDYSYFIKEISENLKLGTNELNFEGRARLYVEMTEERMKELQELVKKGNRDKEIIETLEKLQDQQTKALANLERARARATDVAELLNSIEENVQNQQNLFPQLAYQVVGPAQEAFQKALIFSNETLSKVENLKANLR